MSLFFFFFFWVLGKATDTKKELIRKVRSGRQDGWGVLLYPNGKQGFAKWQDCSAKLQLRMPRL